MRHCHWQLHGALDLAVNWGQADHNAADRVKPPEPDHFEGRSVTPAELASLLEASQRSPLATLVLLAVDSRAREGELLDLRWSDVSLADGTIQVSRSVRRIKGEYVFSEPKTKRGRRSVGVSTPTVEVLRTHRQRQLEQRIRTGGVWTDLELVFPTETGKPQDATAISRAFAKVAKDAGPEGLRFHDLRHSSVSLLLQSGEPMADVSRRAGHATIGVTVDTYGHRLGTGGSMAATMGTILGQAINDPTRWLANG